jgi:hypothetical protein
VSQPRGDRARSRSERLRIDVDRRFDMTNAFLVIVIEQVVA